MMTHAQSNVGHLFLAAVGKTDPEKIKDPKPSVQEAANFRTDEKLLRGAQLYI